MSYVVFLMSDVVFEVFEMHTSVCHVMRLLINFKHYASLAHHFP